MAHQACRRVSTRGGGMAGGEFPCGARLGLFHGVREIFPPLGSGYPGSPLAGGIGAPPKVDSATAHSAATESTCLTGVTAARASRWSSS
jgi:hypothetical protein